MTQGLTIWTPASIALAVALAMGVALLTSAQKPDSGLLILPEVTMGSFLG